MARIKSGNGYRTTMLPVVINLLGYRHRAHTIIQGNSDEEISVSSITEICVKKAYLIK